MVERLSYTQLAKVRFLHFPPSKNQNMIFKENKKEYVCFYGHRFLGKDAKLLAFKNQSRALVGHLVYVKSEDDEYYQGGHPPEGYLLCCPVCGIVQLGGFVCPDDKRLDHSKVDEIAKRNIQLQL